MLKKYLSLFLTLIFLLTAENVSGQGFDTSQLRVMHPPDTENICTLEPTDIDAHFFIGPSREMDDRLKQAATTTFEVDYFIEQNNSCGATTWPVDAREAFDFAIDIWSTHLRSDVPIRVQAIWRNIESEPGTVVLGNAGPTRIVQWSDDDLVELNTWYTLAQLSAMTGLPLREQIEDSEGNTLQYDVVVNINCDFDDWYFGTDASVPDGRTDFITVVLHEIGHGIGFIGSASGDNDTRTGEYGRALMGGNVLMPFIYDIFVEDADFFSLLNETIYPNPSGQIYNALISRRGGLFFEGEDANMTLQEEEADRAKLYTPDPYRAGSSYSHVDHETFKKTVNALMRPRIDRAMAIHTPGPLFCGMLSDMGWPLGAGCLSFLASDAIIAVSETELDFGVTNVGDKIQLSFTISNEPSAIETLSGAVEISGDGFSLLSNSTFSLEPGENTTVNVQYAPDKKDRHSGTLRILHNANNVQSPIIMSLKGEALEEDQVVKLEQSYPNPVVPTTPSPTIPYAISRDADVSLDLFSINGHHLQSLVQSFQNSGRYEVEVDMQGLSSGIYIYRIIVDNVTESGKLMFFK